MPLIEYFPYKGPNRRLDIPVVEILLKFHPSDDSGFPQDVSEIRDLLISGRVLEPDEAFPQVALPEERMAWYTSLLAQTALLFQRKTGHRVSYFSVSEIPGEKRCRALLEHEHSDVGMTAVKLACELLLGERRLLAEPFQMFKKFAMDRLLPVETEAIINAARRRDIPCIHLERSPFRREEFDTLTAGRCIRRNGLLMLGHGTHQRVLDGTYCIDSSEDFSELFKNLEQGLPGGAAAEADPPDLADAADVLLDRLFPSKKPVRMPIIAITGTNGKTTTTRMINHILSADGRRTGMVCTDGVFLDGHLARKGDSGARLGHLIVLTSKDVDFAVLETHHRGILDGGFAFRWCDIAVCLNVTEDHLGDVNIETVEQMAEVKSALPERARHAVVLNADDRHCLAMFNKTGARRKCLVSMESDWHELNERYGNAMACCCVLEVIDGRERLVLYEGKTRLPLMASDSIPATFDGTARFMVSNAMHAIVASYLSGVGVDVIQSAMGSFQAGYDTTPGRLNVFDELPFRVIMDFAHNPDGMRRICEFIDLQDVPGRKIVAFAGTVTRTDDTIRRMGQSMAGHFDFYFCKEHIRSDGTQPKLVAKILQQGLLDKGVTESQTAIKIHGKQVFFEIFDFCQPGDLLIVLLGHVEKHHLPGYIREYASVLQESQNIENSLPE